MALSLSVVILCYRAGKDVKGFVEEVVDCLEKEMDDWQIILVGNYFEGTGDRTPEVVREMAEMDAFNYTPCLEVYYEQTF